jgi:adenylate kinase
MLTSIAFIGGIHGVGKSTICKHICTETGLLHLTASEVLKWKEINIDETNKKVVDVHQTQDRLVTNLSLLIKPHYKYLLDGHYCLLTSNGDVEKVPLETFKQLNPFSLNLIIGDVEKIKARLETRDCKPYDIGLLNEMQNSEIAYANELSKVLNLKLNVGTTEEISQIMKTLKQTMQ